MEPNSNGEINLDAIIHVTPRVVSRKTFDMSRKTGDSHWTPIMDSHDTVVGNTIVRIERTGNGYFNITLTAKSRKSKRYNNVPWGYYWVNDLKLVLITHDEVCAASERAKEKQVIAAVTMRKAALLKGGDNREEE